MDPDIRDIMDADIDRAPTEARVRPLPIVEARGDEPRWESERFPQAQDPRMARLEKLADRYLKHMENDQ